MDNASVTARRAAAVATGVWLAISLTACTSTSGTGTRSGGTPPPVVLTMGTEDPQGRPASNQIEEFARQVAVLTDGTVRIEPRFRVLGGPNVPAWDQEVARMVVGGELDLGMIPARAWDTEGVTTMRALNTPLLLTSDEAVHSVVGDEDLVRDLLTGLDDIGITGLTLVPEGIRRLWSVDGRPGVVDRLAEGGRVRAPRSETTWAVLEALGARPTDAEIDSATVAVESQLSLSETLPGGSSLVGDVALFAKVNSLVANAAAYDDLTEDQQDGLREAAAATRDWAIATQVGDEELARAFCDEGGTIVHEGPAAAGRVRATVGSVTAGLRQDPATAALIDRISDHAEAVTPVTLPTCSPETGDVTVDNVVAEGGALPDGVYRFELTDEWLRDRGLTPGQIQDNHGVWTFELVDGTWSLHQVAPNLEYAASDVYQVRGDELFWRFAGDSFVFHLRWWIDQDGSLRFEDVSGQERYGDFHFMLPWRRVGDATGTGTGTDPVPEVTVENIRAEGGGLPDGTYRAEFTDRYLEDHGLGPEGVEGNHGVWTFTLDAGRWTFDQVAPNITDHAEGIYQVEDDQLWWRLHDEPEVIHMTWAVGDDGSLRFEPAGEVSEPDFQFDLRWQRVD
ncbi:hypothetical protein CFI00_13575 [Nocardioides sp. S5]|uniref:TRAP transporter substrate-binding protein n=1 Tax=Nocardioides sp. S5 TaxID=2017486 RepID=UPI001A8FE9C8|nr:hypothetical protein [Nocardioides sp. S5]QSR31514.1 hypothetical protein CFI00_13575 [Nocardioides sp. S5]